MAVSSHIMETVRQFLAAFAEADGDKLVAVLAAGVSAQVRQQEEVTVYQTPTAVAQALLAERAHWAQKRVDVQGWQSAPPQVDVRFVVQLRPEQAGNFRRYEATLTVRDGQVQRLKLETDVVTSMLPAWEHLQPTSSRRARSG